MKIYDETGKYEKEMEYRTVLEEWEISRDAQDAEQVKHSVALPALVHMIT